MPDAQQHPAWPAIVAMLQPAADYGGTDAWEPGDLVWIAYEGPTIYGAATAHALGRGAEVAAMAGTRFREWIGLIDAEIGAWARDNGADRLTARGRPGWSRFAKCFGWAAIGADDAGRMIFEKEL